MQQNRYKKIRKESIKKQFVQSRESAEESEAEAEDSGEESEEDGIGSGNLGLNPFPVDSRTPQALPLPFAKPQPFRTFDKYWKVYLKTLIEGGMMLTGQVPITKKGLNDLLFRQIHVCNKVFLCVAVANQQQFQEMVGSIAATPVPACAPLLESEVPLELPGKPRRDTSRFWESLDGNRRLTEVEGIPRKPSSLVNPFEGEDLGEGAIFKDFLHSGNLSITHPLDFRAPEEDVSPSPVGNIESRGFSVAAEWLKSTTLLRSVPAEESNGGFKRFFALGQTSENGTTPGGDLPRGFSNSSVYMTTELFEFKEQQKDSASSPDDVPRTNSNESISGYANPQFEK